MCEREGAERVTDTRTGRAPRRVIIADDHMVVREGLTGIVERRGGMVVVASAGTGEGTVAAVLEHPADILVLDLGMPGGSIGTIEAVKAVRPNLPILVYTMHAEREWAARCLLAGASGFLSKSTHLDELSIAIATVARGRRYVSGTVARQLAERLLASSGDAGGAPHHRLSAREHEVFERLVVGESAAEVGAALGISAKTVSTYRGRILEKLGATRTADLTRYAIRHGLIEP